MVILNVKKNNQSFFLYETKTKVLIEELVKDLLTIYNGILHIERICYEMEELAKYGVYLPSKMQGLTADQISELKLKDEWTDQNLNSLEYISNPDPMGLRNGFAPSEKYADILTKTVAEAKARISKKMVESNVCLSTAKIQDTIDILRGAIYITYSMGLPSYEPVQMELTGTRDLAGTQASKEVLQEAGTDIWWANKQLETDKTLSDYIGKNEKSKLIVKLQKKGCGAPAREPLLTEEQKKDLMLAEHRRREQLKSLEEDEDDSYLDNEWADNSQMKRNIIGLRNIKFK